MRFFFIIILFLSVCKSAFSKQDLLENDEKVINNIINLTMKGLKETLIEQIQKGGIESAVNICAEVAPKVTNQNNNKNLSIKRISLKYRNPDNEPSDFERTILLKFEKELKSGKKIDNLVYKESVFEQGIKSIVFIKAIPTKEVCLNCHGSNINYKVLEKLKSLYPDDKAINYKVGQIRGAFSVNYKY